MKLIAFFCLLLCSGFTPPESLTRLIEGNLRYVNDTHLHPNHSSDRREETKLTQNPFAVILGCSDSRVSPEIIFDQGLGDLFIVRVAGNVAGPLELDSIQYAAGIGCSLVLVLGHQSCGAVTAVFDGKGEAIPNVAKLIEPAIDEAKNIEQAIKDNIRFTVQYLKNIPSIKKLMNEGKIDCAGAYYHLESGKIDIL